ncbi:MAG TPA: right-handed parallel beta-helix repeat-containing protein [Saprospiraceae bacterium]|nr:right-handed parallel beta-helix repeat-containing protein [Saprospiraceae bacterium]
MPTFTLIPGNQQMAFGRINHLSKSIWIGCMFIIGLGNPLWGSTINVPADHLTISAAVAAASNGDLILVAPGTYNENVTINKANLTLKSTGGAAVTTIQGSDGQSGTIAVSAGIDGVTIGGVGQGFTIIGYDGPGTIERAAIYLIGAHNNITIVGNVIQANGEHGLLSEFNASIDGIYITDNTFSGKTFVGAEPGGCGFSTQFDPGNNVPRQLVVMGGGSGVTNSKNVYFFKNTLTGTAGGYNTGSSCEQGNYLVTIDVIGGIIAENTFNGTTTRFAGNLRARGKETSIYCNTFHTTGLGNDCTNIFFGSSNPINNAFPSTLAGVASYNEYPNGGAYLTPDNAGSYVVFRSMAQANAAAAMIGAGQTAVAAASSYSCPATNTTIGRKYPTIQSAINAAATLDGHSISVAAGTFVEDVDITKDLTLKGAGIDQTTVSGPIGGQSATFKVSDSGVTIEGFTITREGNNVTDWNNSGLNTAGIAIQGQTVNAEVRDCKLTGNRTGIDINNSNNCNIHNNQITFNRTGMILRNQTDNTLVNENEITDNWTIGVLFLDGSGGSNVPPQQALNSSFNENNISGNWYGQIQDRQAGGSLPAPGTNLKDFECNWLGTTSPTKDPNNSSEPGYSAQIPVLYGGTAEPPVTPQPHVLGVAADNLDYLLFLVSGIDDSPSEKGFQPQPLTCTGGCAGGGVVINENTSQIYCSIQDAYNAASSGHRLKVKSGTYTENVDFATGGKSLTFAPGNSPGCVTINGNYTLNSGDVLEMEIEGLTACTQHDKLIVNGAVNLGNATLSLPASMFLVEDGDQITIIENDGADAVVGMFKQGNFAFDGQNQYYIDYKGGDGNDVVLSKCCGALIDLGISTTTVGAPAGQKLLIKAKPNKDAVYGAYSQGTFTLRTLSTNAVPNFTPANISSDFGYLQIGSKQSSGGYDYFVFNFEALPDTADLKNWTAGIEQNLATLTYGCAIGNATFELVNDAFAISIGGEFYQELSGETNPGAQGAFYASSATGPTVVSLTATSNSPVCQTMEIDLSSTTSNGSPSYSYVWAGPDSYSNNVADPAPFTADLVDAGVYNVTVTDGNGCTATASTTVVVPATGACVKNENTVKYYPTITQAIDAALTLDGHTLTVPVGTWAENVVVDKELTINGPKVGVNGCDPGRGAGEAVVVPATNAVGSGEIFHVEASNVTIDGFTIDGDNTLLVSGVTNPTGADMNAAEGVTIYVDNKSNLKVRNNVFKNLSYFGVTLFGASFSAPATAGHVISNNKFQDFGTYNDPQPNPSLNINYWGGGVLLYNNQYTNVKDNCMENVRIGIQTGNYAQANPGAAVYQEIDNNTISARRRGIFHNLHYSAASGLTLKNNDITAVANANETVWDGILLASLSVPSTSQDNTIDGSGVTNPSEGYEVWNVKNTFPTAISGGSVSNVSTGLFVNNFNGYNSDATDGAHATVSSLSITPGASGTGIRVLDNPSSTHANVQLQIGSGVIVTNGAKGLVVENASASIVGGTLNNIAFTGQSGNYIELISNAGNLNGMTATYAGTTGAMKSLTDNFATEDKILHKVDNLTLGLVRVKAGEIFVTPNSGSVQRGVNASTVGDIVNVANGTYNEDVEVNKDITLDGESQAAIIRGLYAAGLGHSVLISASNATIKDLKVTRDYGATVTDWYNCPKNQGVTIGNSTTGVTVENVWITGNRNGLYINNAQGFIVQNNTIEDNRTGIQLVNNISNGQIKNNFIRNNFTLGVLYNVFSGTNLIGTNHELNDNNISGNWYAQLAFHQTGGTYGDLTGFDQNCNWYGTVTPDYAAIPAGEPGYSSQVPSQFGGTDPGLTRDIRGTLAHLLTYIPFTTNGTDNAPADGFQPVPGSCNGLGPVVNQTQNLTYPTIQLAIDDAIANDVIYAPAGTYSENVVIDLPLVLKGNNELNAGCGTRVAESIISGGGGTAVTIASNGVSLLGFQLVGHTGVSSTGFTDVVIKNNRADVQVFGIASAGMTTSGTDEYTIQDNCVDLLCAGYETFPFNVNPTLSATQLAGAWYTDRYAPNGFVSASFGGGNRLKHSINAADTQGDPFYNTQGRKYDIAGTKAMSIQLYVPSAWGTQGRRMAGFWGTAVDNSNNVTDYPIIEFSSDGGVPRFRGWKSDPGVWVDMGLPTGFAYDQWYTLNIALMGTNVVYNVGDLELIVPADPSVTSIANVILQGYNHAPGLTYDIYWDNLNTYCSPASTANMPTVGVALTAAGGSDDVTLQGNGISDAFYGYLLSGVATTPRTTITGGSYTNLLQGVAVVNTLDGITYTPSTVGVSNVSMTSFSGNYPAMPAANFHAGVYAFTGGSNAAHNIDLLLNNVTVKNTGKTAPNSAGLYFADFSTGAGNRLNAVVNESNIEDNKNRGVQTRGANATVTVNTSSILNNGADPFGTGGNDGFGVYAGVGSAVTLLNNFIANPATQVGYTVTALYEGVAPASTIEAHDNSILRNGNGLLAATTTGLIDADCNWWGNTNPNVFDEFINGNVVYAPYLNSGVDNSGSTGFQPQAGTCVNLTDYYVNDNSTAGDLITFAVGLDAPGTRGTAHRPYRHMNAAITAASNGNTIRVDIGNYNDEQVLVNKDLTVLGTDGLSVAKPVVNFTGTSGANQTVFHVTSTGVTIEHFTIEVDMSKLHSAIVAPAANGTGLTVKNNTINPYRSAASYVGAYGNRNAININHANYYTGGSNPTAILVEGNTVNYSSSGNPPISGNDDAGFRSGAATDEGVGSFIGNTFQTINHDIIARFSGPGAITIDDNTFNGGGIELAEFNSATGALTITDNDFDGTAAAPGTAVLRLKNNQQNKQTTVSGNTLNNAQWAMSVENYKNLTVDNNTFTPLAGSTDFLHVGVNTKLINSNSNSIMQTQINGSFTNNTFNGSGVAGGTAIGFFNHDSDAADIGAFTIGTNGNENEFKANIATFARLDDQLGSTDPATFPTNYPDGGGWTTTMACWNKDVDLTHNKFDIGSGLEKPLDMTSTERNTLETKLYHKPDNACLGRFFQPVEVMAKVYLQGPYDTPSNKMNDVLRTLADFPLTEPHTQINTDYPGSFVKKNNSVTETITAAVRDNADVDNAIVDWIWLELRDKNDHTKVLFTRSALLQRDGDVVDLDGTSEVVFPDAYQDNFYLMVRHRNHLGAMTAAPVNFSAPPLVDFTTSAQATFGTTPTSARRLVETNVYGLWAGNTFPKTLSGNFNLMYNGASNDRLPILTRVGITTPLNVVNGYYLEDVNMNGQVKYNGANNDRVIILNNVGSGTPLNIITQEPNN